MSFAVALVTLACGLLLLDSTAFLVRLSHLRRLDPDAPPEPPAWPRVSVIIPARDEARDVAETIRTRLADDYPNLELILVDDRSEDGTARIAAEAAAGDPRLTIVRVDELPPGWLGKVHAMQRGVLRAAGDWLLFSDGDVSIRRGTLRLAVAYSLSRRTDLLALVPRFGGGLLMAAMWGVFGRGLLAAADPRAVEDPTRDVAVASGSFILVRRAAFDRAGGFEPLRMETLDDVGLALMVKRAGGRTELLDGTACVFVSMYHSFGAFLRGIEKNGSSMAGAPFAATAVVSILLMAGLFAPSAAFAFGPTWLRLLAAVALGGYTLSSVIGLWKSSRRWLPGFLWPVGAVLMFYGVLRAVWLAKRNGGVRWRETFYSLDELNRGRRVRFIRLLWPGRRRRSVLAVVLISLGFSAVSQAARRPVLLVHEVVRALRAEDRCGLLSFSHDISLDAGLTTERSAVHDAIDGIRPVGLTSILDAAYSALSLSEPPDRRLLLLLFSDGLDNRSWTTTADVLPLAARSDAVVASVAFRVSSSAFGPASDAPQPDLPFLRALTADTGGDLLVVNRYEEFSRAFATMLERARARYLITYYPTGIDRAGWHQVKVSLKGKKGQVTTRRGYMVGP